MHSHKATAQRVPSPPPPPPPYLLGQTCGKVSAEISVVQAYDYFSIPNNVPTLAQRRHIDGALSVAAAVCWECFIVSKFEGYFKCHKCRCWQSKRQTERDRARATTCTICFRYAFSEWCAIAVFNRLLHRKSVLCNCVKLIGGNKLPGFVRPTTRATHKARVRSRGRGLEGGRSERVFSIFHGKFNR